MLALCSGPSCDKSGATGSAGRSGASNSGNFGYSGSGMRVSSTPMRWPAAWADPATLALLKGTGIDTLLIDNSDEFDSLRTRATQSGLKVVHPDAPPDGVRIVKGEWPGVRSGRGGGGVSAGPTGVAWVDSNGWAVRNSLPRCIPTAPLDRRRAAEAGVPGLLSDGGRRHGGVRRPLDRVARRRAGRGHPSAAMRTRSRPGRRSGRRPRSSPPTKTGMPTRRPRAVGGHLQLHRRQRVFQPRVAQPAGPRRAALLGAAARNRSRRPSCADLRAVLYADAERALARAAQGTDGVCRGRRPADHHAGMGRRAGEDRDDHPRYYGWAAGKGQNRAEHRAARTIPIRWRTTRWCW